MSETTFEVLAADLVALGRTLRVAPPGPGLEAAVLARVALLPPPAAEGVVRRAVRETVAVATGRRRAFAAAGVALLVGLTAAPPVRAAVADWFGFAGVQVHRGAGPPASTSPTVPSISGPRLAEARRLVAFEPVVPAALGRPEAVEVSDDRRVLSMGWDDADGQLRLDQFDGELDFGFAKTAPEAQYTTVGGDFALWFPVPHEVVLLNADGTRRTESARLAGRTLIWTHGSTTLRLEGDIGLERAREIAESTTG